MEVLQLRAIARRRKHRKERNDVLYEALHGIEAQNLRLMIDERADMVYYALRDAPSLAHFERKYEELRQAYTTLVQLCDAKRSYEVPPEYSGVLNVEARKSWSPTDTEVARVLVGCTIASIGLRVLYSDLVARIVAVTSMARPHVYRSLKIILRTPPGTTGVVDGIRLL